MTTDSDQFAEQEPQDVQIELLWGQLRDTADQLAAEKFPNKKAVWQQVSYDLAVELGVSYYDESKEGVEKARQLNSDRQVFDLIGEQFMECENVEQFDVTMRLFGRWLRERQDLHETQFMMSSPKFHISPRSSWESVLKGAAHLVGQDIAHLPGVADSITRVHDQFRNEQESASSDETRFWDIDTEDLAILVATLQTGVELPERELGLRTKVLGALSDRGVIPMSFWYEEGFRVVHGKLPFAFYEEFHQRLEAVMADPVLKSSHYQRALIPNTESYIQTILNKMANDPDRDAGNTKAIADTLSRQRGGATRELLLPSVVKLANVITTSINKAGGVIVDFEDGQPVMRPLPVLDSHRHLEESMGPALLRILYATRDRTSDKDGFSEQAFQDRVYADILSFILSGKRTLDLAPSA